MSTRTANAAKQSTAKPAVRKTRTTKATAQPAVKVKPIEALVVPDKTQKSVRVHLTLDQLPKGNGGVRYKEQPAKDGSKVFGQLYIDQPTFALLNKPKAIIVTAQSA